MSARLPLMLMALGAAVVAMAARPKAFYELIISSEPFGPMAAEVQAEAEVSVALDPKKVQEESNKINLCAMTETPDGRTAVGLIDNGVSPPAYITLFAGETANGLELVLSDLDGEFATFRREGVTFTLGLGLGLLETITPEVLAQRQVKAEEEAAEAAAKAEAAAERERKKPNSLAEQLIAMQMSLPPDVEAPPLPIPIGDDIDFTQEFEPGKERGAPETETEAIVQAGVAELKEAVASGESAQSYLRRLVEHRSAEVQRQKREQAAAREAIEATLSTGQLSESEAAAVKRQANLELMKKGVVPLEPVENITAAEQAEIDAALEAL